MLKLSQGVCHQLYVVQSIEANEKLKKRLQDLGIVPDATIVLIQSNKDSGIVMLKNSRLALDIQVLSLIEVKEQATRKEWLSLDQVAVGQTVKVVGIHGQGAIKRRLMDMGVTKHLTIFVHKVAPLGDPIEINLRGYTLTLRKAEAALILVERDVAV
ncbi:ferrous iron transport protein A [Enterococcus columbae]|uniref:Ferrous iron transporter FeoA-like domain-containing protein n=1 Tax=Enterococcus columbae DSM 7374 = ATCC 51263 TaxID=1121865 RepID=S0KJ96_9ENTE|nr:FeoA family protein [Enterococcus columbae]EOT44854.1 hypothetical protein OMW_00039 [Enterococcus columbae DSM 7374 = ATCC 51263]EOW84147.1 hypothetical protein I568_00633 [Enterococcus columbae DSM 7374 = ATCC 51263]OJG23338.1 hypothetical protein RR47_GL000574 [Enterococcus columbae DSM 7374 = ATCC 51263]